MMLDQHGSGESFGSQALPPLVLEDVTVREVLQNLTKFLYYQPSEVATHTHTYILTITNKNLFTNWQS